MNHVFAQLEEFGIFLDGLLCGFEGGFKSDETGVGGERFFLGEMLVDELVPVLVAALVEGGEKGLLLLRPRGGGDLQGGGHIPGQAGFERLGGRGRPETELAERIFAAAILAVNRQGEGAAFFVDRERLVELEAGLVGAAFVAADGPAFDRAVGFSVDGVFHIKAVLDEIGSGVFERDRERFFGIAPVGHEGGVEFTHHEIAVSVEAGTVAGEPFIREGFDQETGDPRGRFHRNGHGVDHGFGRSAREEASVGFGGEGDAALFAGGGRGGCEGRPLGPESGEGQSFLPLRQLLGHGRIVVGDHLRGGGDAFLLLGFGLFLFRGGFGLVLFQGGFSLADLSVALDLAGAAEGNPVGLGPGEFGGEELMIGFDADHDGEGSVDLRGRGSPREGAVVDLLDEFAVVGLGRDEGGQFALGRSEGVGDGWP